MKTYSPKLLLEEGIVFPEGPRWHEGRLWFSDMHAHRIRAVDTKGKAELILDLDDRPSGLGWLPDGGLLLVRFRKRDLVVHTKQGVKPHADLAPLASGFINDMVVDGKGRSYVGGWAPVHGAPPPQPGQETGDSVILVTADRKPRSAAGNMVGPNGMVITADGKTLVVGETRGRKLIAFDIAADGSLSRRRVFADFKEITPDGICVDAEGAVWVSSFQTGEFVRVKDGGTVTDRIHYPGRHAVACMLGGTDRRTLFLLTARMPPNHLATLRSFEDDLRSQSRGTIETVRVDVPGAGWP